jgi:DNA-binding XRE family transcriptional regulator
MNTSKTKKTRTFKINFATFIVAARTNMGITQTELAKRLHVTRSFVCDLEKGRLSVSPKLAMKIAKLAGLSEQVAVTLCLQDILERAEISYKVELKAA